MQVQQTAAQEPALSENWNPQVLIDDYLHLLELKGPEDTPYFGGVFQIEINIPER